MTRRIALDTNLWSDIGDEMAAATFDELMNVQDVEVAIAPSVLLEVLRLSRVEERARIVEAMARGPRRHRLPSEAQSQSAELIAEIRRCRPEWLRSMPDTAKVASLNALWTKRIWRGAVDQADRLHQQLILDKADRSFMYDVQRQQRREALRVGYDATRLSAIKAYPPPPPHNTAEYMAGWDGSPVDEWRLHNRDIWWHALVTVVRSVFRQESTTLADWVGAYVDLSRLRADKPRFTSFWLEDVRASAVPRNWLRWAVSTAQIARHVSKGNPIDDQHGAYLLDSDVFLTADADYFETLRVVRSHAPVDVAEPRLVPNDSGIGVVQRIAAAM